MYYHRHGNKHQSKISPPECLRVTYPDTPAFGIKRSIGVFPNPQTAYVHHWPILYIGKNVLQSNVTSRYCMRLCPPPSTVPPRELYQILGT